MARKVILRAFHEEDQIVEEPTNDLLAQGLLTFVDSAETSDELTRAVLSYMERNELQRGYLHYELITATGQTAYYTRQFKQAIDFLEKK